MDPRVKAVNKFTLGMMDLKIKRHPLRQDVTVVLCDVTTNLYRDTTSVPKEEYQKQVILIKNVELSYINDAIGELLDDGDLIPWIAVMTLTGLPRTLRKGDYIKVEGSDYKVSGVKPYNRVQRDIIQCFLHPERDDFDTTVQ